MKINIQKYAEVAVFLPLPNTFTYRVPPELSGLALPGVRVIVPLGKRTVTGCVVSLNDEPGTKGIREIKDIGDVLDITPLFDEKRLRFYSWLSSYYFAPLGMVLSLINPAGSHIKSTRRITVTAKGTESAKEMTGLEKEILASSIDGVSVSALLKRFRNKPVYGAIERLKKSGLVDEEIVLKGGERGLFEKIISLCPEPPSGTPPVSGRAPLQARVLEYLEGKGEVPLDEMTKDLGAVRDAVKRLETLGLVKVSERRAFRSPISEFSPKASDHEPNVEQSRAIGEITSAMRKGGFSPFLLYGVTGSGKTLVYMKAIEEAVRSGKRVLFLVPEISLTPWPTSYLMDRFPGSVALYHSALSEGERMDEWRRISAGEAAIVVGARSALFTPLKDLGLIIVDEEHEASYKQEEGVRYNGRDSALMLAKYLGITIVLGSATPSVETFYNATTGKLTPLYLRNRVSGRNLPSVEIEDGRGGGGKAKILKNEEGSGVHDSGVHLKGEAGVKGGAGNAGVAMEEGGGGEKGRKGAEVVKGGVISQRLKSLMGEVLANKHQVILFLNRRGFSGSLICRDCGHVFKCLNCSVSLTAHKGEGVLKCHYCGFALPLPGECPKCRGIRLAEPGAGTERVEEEVKALFPGVRTMRMDRDTTSRKGSVREMIGSFEDRQADVLIGTQMVSKGHHFPGVALVGIISGDTSLNIPDFRSAERTFQLVTQASGRAGRGEEEGRVVIQTLNPEHYCFRNALTHDYEGFYGDEIRMREEALYPPFARLCVMRVEGIGEDRTAKAASLLKSIADSILKRKGSDVTVLGPAPAILSKLKGRYRHQLLVKGRDVKVLHPFVAELKKAFESRIPPGVTLTVDMDPAGTG